MAKKKEKVEEPVYKYVQPKSKRVETFELAQELGFDCEIDYDGVLMFYCEDEEDRERIRAWCLENISTFSWGISGKSFKNKPVL